MDSGESLEHLSRQVSQPLAGMLDEPLAGGKVSCPHQVQPGGGLA
jgi:hypothetical protein